MIDERTLDEALLRASRCYRDACHAARVLRDRNRLPEAVGLLNSLRDTASLLIACRLSMENAPKLLEAIDLLEEGLAAPNTKEDTQ